MMNLRNNKKTKQEYNTQPNSPTSNNLDSTEKYPVDLGAIIDKAELLDSQAANHHHSDSEHVHHHHHSDSEHVHHHHHSDSEHSHHHHSDSEHGHHHHSDSEHGHHHHSDSEHTHHHHHHHHHESDKYGYVPKSKKGKDKNETSDDSREYSYLFEKNYYKKPEIKKKLKKRQIALIVLAGILVLTAIAWLIIIFIGERQLATSNTLDKKDIHAIVDEDVVSYKGNKYKFNKNVVSILCMGIDNDSVSTSEEYGANGQADAIFLVTINTRRKKIDITSIPRDSIVNVKTYSVTGKYLGIDRKQLCLAYAYGDGGSFSCENVCQSVSEYLYGMNVSNYYAIDYDAIPKIAAKIGNVEVTPNETFKAGTTTYTENTSVVLNKNTTLSYLRGRNKHVDSSYLRMERQLDYISSAAPVCVENTKNDITYPIDLYNTLKSESVTNLGLTKISYIVSQMFKGDTEINIHYHQIYGEQVAGANNYAEFNPDETKLFELVLELYYDKMENQN